MNSSDLAINVKDLLVCFNGFTAVDHISFNITRGEIFGLLGANGAGKTTTIRVLCGLLTPTSGFVSVAGITPDGGSAAIKEQIGYMSQKFTLYDDMSVLENLLFAGSLRKMNSKELQDKIKKLLNFISFNRSVKTFVSDLPAGIKQQVSLAAALLHSPAIIFLDEPTAGVSPAARIRFWELIKDLAQTGHTILVTTHYMDEAQNCDRIAFMREGKIVALDTPHHLMEMAFPSQAQSAFSKKSTLEDVFIKIVGGNA